MQPLLRILAVLLVLTTGGVFQTLAFAADVHADCEDEATGDCTDCSSACALCLCCPLRAAPVPAAIVDEPAAPPALPPVLFRVDEPVLSGTGADIFQPPRV